MFVQTRRVLQEVGGASAMRRAWLSGAGWRLRRLLGHFLHMKMYYRFKKERSFVFKKRNGSYLFVLCNSSSIKLKRL